MSYCRKQDPFYKITVWARRRHIYCQNSLSHLNTRKYCKKKTRTIQSLENAEVLNILQTSIIRNTWQAVSQAARFKLHNHSQTVTTKTKHQQQ